jgi:hypothetical protein
MNIRASPLVGGMRGIQSKMDVIEDSETDNSNSNTNSGFFNAKTYNSFDRIKENFERVKKFCYILYIFQMLYSVLWIFIATYLLLTPFHCLISGLMLVI